MKHMSIISRNTIIENIIPLIGSGSMFDVFSDLCIKTHFLQKDNIPSVTDQSSYLVYFLTE